MAETWILHDPPFGKTTFKRFYDNPFYIGSKRFTYLAIIGPEDDYDKNQGFVGVSYDENYYGMIREDVNDVIYDNGWDSDNFHSPNVLMFSDPVTDEEFLQYLTEYADKHVPAVNKVDINGETVIDLTADTVTPETLDAGVTAHNSAGEVITGTREAVSYPLPVSKGGTGATTAAAALANLGAPSLHVFNNVTVAASAFAASDRYAGYPYAATIALSGVTESMYPDVAFDVTDASGGNFAPVAVSQNGSVLIFAAEPKAITIPTILLMG